MEILIFPSAILFFLAAGFLLIRRERRSREKLEKEIRDLNFKLQTALGRFEEERARLETTFSGMAEGVLVTDREGGILHANPAFREMFHFEKNAEGRSALEVLANVACDDAIRSVIQGGWALEREIEFEKPKRCVFQIHFSPMRRGGKFFGVVSVFHDLTEVKRLEAVRRDFIANLSHELKTPLTAIKGFSETLLEESMADPEEARKHLGVIFRHANDLSHLMENLLNLSRIESGKEEVRLEPVPLKTFVDHLLERFLVEAKAKQIQIHNQIPESAPSLEADPAKLNQILSNLVDNALKYSPEGSQVWVRAEAAPEKYQIEVEDNGPGIPEEDQKRIFERFYRVDRARSRETGGAGLGLAIVKHLVELHGARICVQSKPGSGSRFQISLPPSP